jgi:hypothetical protein
VYTVCCCWNGITSFCDNEKFGFNVVLTQLVKTMTVICVGEFLFMSSMTVNLIYGILTGIGTINQLKKQAMILL